MLILRGEYDCPLRWQSSDSTGGEIWLLATTRKNAKTATHDYASDASGVLAAERLEADFLPPKALFFTPFGVPL